MLNRGVNSDRRYIKWIYGHASPEILTIADYDMLIDSNCLFARKFDDEVDREVIKKIVEHVTK